MSLTQNWKRENYLNHIVKNKLDVIWHGWCNPQSTDGIRLSAYTPIFPDDDTIIGGDRKCSRKNCNGKLIIPDEDIKNRVMYKRVCNGIDCKAYENIMYRWVSQKNKTKLWFSNPDVVRHYAGLGRAFYGTLSLYKQNIISPNSQYVDESLMVGHSLGIDIDIKRGKGTICDLVNREEMDRVLDVLRDELDTFIPNSYNLQTSGNGVYIFIHHSLVTTDIFNQMGKFNAWIIHMNNVLKQNNITRIKIDPINMPSRVYKLMGSIHQKYDLVAIPLQHDCRLSNMSSDDFKLKSFDINDYIIDDKLRFYNRCDQTEHTSLYDFLEEHMNKSPMSELRAIRYKYKDAVEITTGEEQNDDSQQIKEDAEKFYEYYAEWKQLKIDIPGRVMHKITPDGRRNIEMLGVSSDDDINRILDELYNTGG